MARIWMLEMTYGLSNVCIADFQLEIPTHMQAAKFADIGNTGDGWSW